MGELPELTEVREAWLKQPAESAPVEVERLQRMRANELFAATRSETMASLAAALFLAGMAAWMFDPEREPAAWVVFGVVMVWAVVTLVWRRSALRQNLDPAMIARPGIQHYQTELIRRRDHLRSAWLWYGPLALGAMFAAATLAQGVAPRRLWNALPLALALVGWVATATWKRRQQAAALQREIESIVSDFAGR